MKLRRLLLAVFALVIAVPLVLFWAWPYSRSMTNEIDDVRDRHLLIAEILASSLEHYLSDITTSFSLIYVNLIDQGQFKGAERLLQDLNFRNICIFESEDGALKFRVDSFDNRCPEVLEGEALSFFLTLAPGDEVAVSPVLAGPEGAPTLYVAAQQDGLLALGALYTDFVVELGKSIAFGRKGHAVVVDHTGQVLAHPDDAWVAARRSLMGIDPLQQAIEGETGIATFVSPFMNVDVIAGFATVEGVGWGVMVAQPLSELREKADANSRSALIVVVVGLLVALVIGSLVAFYMTRPLRAVSQAVRRMAAGNTEARTAVSEGMLVPAEVRDLQTSFNAMADAMERSKRDEHDARLRAEEANRSKSAFLANMSHELRTPLNAILGFSEVILAETFGKIGSARYEEYLRDIRGSARHLLALINDLLDLSRIEAGAIELKETWFDLTEILEECASMFRDSCASADLDLKLESPAGGVTILADERALRQILINLLSNAVRHTPGGGEVVVSARLQADGGVELSVADTGVGIPEGDLKRVLQPFEQVTRNQGRPHEGTGLGLSIVKQLVDLHGGDLVLKSQVGKGTSVSFSLPPGRVQLGAGGNRAQSGASGAD